MRKVQCHLIPIDMSPKRSLALQLHLDITTTDRGTTKGPRAGSGVRDPFAQRDQQRKTSDTRQPLSLMRSNRSHTHAKHDLS